MIESINSILESLHNEFNLDNRDVNSEQLSNFFKILRMFAKDNENIEKMAEYVIKLFNILGYNRQTNNHLWKRWDFKLRQRSSLHFTSKTIRWRYIHQTDIRKY